MKGIMNMKGNMSLFIWAICTIVTLVMTIRTFFLNILTYFIHFIVDTTCCWSSRLCTTHVGVRNEVRARIC